MDKRLYPLWSSSRIQIGPVLSVALNDDNILRGTSSGGRSTASAGAYTVVNSSATAHLCRFGQLESILSQNQTPVIKSIMSQCCLSGYKWDGKPTGKETKLGKNDTYITGSNKEVGYYKDHHC